MTKVIVRTCIISNYSRGHLLWSWIVYQSVGVVTFLIPLRACKYIYDTLFIIIIPSIIVISFIPVNLLDECVFLMALIIDVEAVNFVLSKCIHMYEQKIWVAFRKVYIFCGYRSSRVISFSLNKRYP